jgi:hypothetical protein
MDPARHHRRRQVVWTGHNISAGYGIDGSNIPTMVPVRDPNDPSLTTFASTDGSAGWLD